MKKGAFLHEFEVGIERRSGLLEEDAIVIQPQVNGWIVEVDQGGFLRLQRQSKEGVLVAIRSGVHQRVLLENGCWNQEIKG
jgi:hypothetical protein